MPAAPSKKIAGIDLHQLDLEADALEIGLHHLLRLLADLVDRRRVGQRELDVVLLADIAVERPACLVEDLGGLPRDRSSSSCSAKSKNGLPASTFDSARFVVAVELAGNQARD